MELSHSICQTCTVPFRLYFTMLLPQGKALEFDVSIEIMSELYWRDLSRLSLIIFVQSFQCRFQRFQRFDGARSGFSERESNAERIRGIGEHELCRGAFGFSDYGSDSGTSFGRRILRGDESSIQRADSASERL